MAQQNNPNFIIYLHKEAFDAIYELQFLPLPGLTKLKSLQANSKLQTEENVN